MRWWTEESLFTSRGVDQFSLSCRPMPRSRSSYSPLWLNLAGQVLGKLTLLG